MAADMAKIQALGKAWTHPGNGEVRYYVSGEKVAKIAGLVDAPYGRGVGGLSHSQYAALVGCKFWFTEDGELHVKGELPRVCVEGFQGSAGDIATDALKAAVEEDVPEEAPEVEACGEVTEEALGMDVPEEDEEEDDEEEEDTISRDEFRTLLETSEVMGGITDVDGDQVQLKSAEGAHYSVYLCACFGDRVPSIDETVATAVKVEFADGFEYEVLGEPEDVALTVLRWDETEERYMDEKEARARAEEVSEQYRVEIGTYASGRFEADEVLERKTEEEVQAIVKVMVQGTSLVLPLTRELKRIGAGRGDYVKVTIRRTE